MKRVKLTEKDLTNIVKKVINENKLYRGGFVFSDSVDSEVVQSIINRMTKYHTEFEIKGNEEYRDIYRSYIDTLIQVNEQFPL